MFGATYSSTQFNIKYQALETDGDVSQSPGKATTQPGETVETAGNWRWFRLHTWVRNLRVATRSYKAEAGTRIQDLGWRNLREASMLSSFQLPRSLLRSGLISKLGWTGGAPESTEQRLSLEVWQNSLFLFLTWQLHKHKFIVKWIIERKQFEFSPRQLCLKRLFPRK